MSKDPAFLFYPNDYIGGTMGMTFEEKGAYIELLMMQFNRGHMTTHMVGQTVGQLWDTVQVKFKQDDKGLWYNVRLDEEKSKRQKFTESRRNNTSGKNQYSKKVNNTSGHMTSHMENEDENEVEDRKVNKNCLMKNSGITIEQVSEAFSKADDIKNADARYYFNTAMDWSNSKGEMRKDWIAAVRNFPRKDLKDGKMKISAFKQDGGSNLSNDKIKVAPEPVSKSAMTREEWKNSDEYKQKFNKP